MLGHRDLDSTALYTELEIEDLLSGANAMKLKILNRIRQGNEVVAEVPSPQPEVRRWVSVRKPRTRDIRDPLFEESPFQHEVRIAEQPVFSDPHYFFDNEGYRVIEVHLVRSESELLELLPTLVPSADLFDVPWRVYVP
jgi:hypothetical protein